MKKFAVKVHNKYLSEAVQKLAEDNGYTKFGTEYEVSESVLYFEYKRFTWLYFKSLEYYPEIPIYSALTDWTKIEEAMKPKEPRVIWVGEFSRGLGAVYNSKEELINKSMGFNLIKAIKFQEVIE